jgi:hypothetical protein
MKAQGKLLRPTGNSLIKGGTVVVLNKDPSVKEPIIESKYHKEFKGSGAKVLKGNVLALPNNKRSAELQGADVRTGAMKARVQPMFPGSSSASGKGVADDAIKIPISLKKKKEKRNNIRLVL